MPRHTFSFEFSELPLVIENGFEAGLVNGSAEIAYYPDGDWFIDSISLDGAKRNTADSPVFDRKSIPLDEGSSLFLSIHHRLENEKRDDLNEAVLEQIEAERVDLRAIRWDRVRDLRKHELA